MTDKAEDGMNQWQQETNERMRHWSAESDGPVVSLKPMQLSGGRTDYFVSIAVGDREVTPHVFREEYKAAYHVALYDWLLNGSGEEPDVMDFGPGDWPARVIHPAPPAAASVRKAQKAGWVREITNMIADRETASRIVELAELTGLFDAYEPAPAAPTLEEIELTPEQVFLINDMMKAWLGTDLIAENREYRESFRNDCKRLLATQSQAETVAPAWTLQDDLMSLLEAIDHTVSIHGKMDRGTPLHERLERSIALMRPRLQGGIASIPSHLNFLIGRGKSRPDEPLYGVQILDGLKVLAETENDDLDAAIGEALAALSRPHCGGES